MESGGPWDAAPWPQARLCWCRRRGDARFCEGRDPLVPPSAVAASPGPASSAAPRSRGPGRFPAGGAVAVPLPDDGNDGVFVVEYTDEELAAQPHIDSSSVAVAADGDPRRRRWAADPRRGRRPARTTPPRRPAATTARPGSTNNGTALFASTERRRAARREREQREWSESRVDGVALLRARSLRRRARERLYPGDGERAAIGALEARLNAHFDALLDEAAGGVRSAGIPTWPVEALNARGARRAADALFA